MKTPQTYPQYAVPLQMEDQSLALLQYICPVNWLVRPTIVRDIGVDGEIELHEGGLFKGQLFKFQLKSAQKIEWRQDDGVGISSKIKVSTANYWLELGLPVFLLQADLSEQTIYFQAVGPQLRQRFREMQKHQEIHLKLHREQRIDSPQGMAIFERQYVQARDQTKLMGLAARLLFGLRDTAQFLEEAQGRDEFMEVEPDVQERLRVSYKLYADLCDDLEGITVISYWDLVRQCQKEIGKVGEFHEYTATELCRQIEQKLPLFAKLLLKKIQCEERQYWGEKYPELVDHCDSLSSFVEHLAERVLVTPLGLRWRQFGNYQDQPR